MPGITHPGPCGIKAAHHLEPCKTQKPPLFSDSEGSKVAACDHDALSPGTWGFEGTLLPDLCHPYMTHPYTVSPTAAPLGIKDGSPFKAWYATSLLGRYFLPILMLSQIKAFVAAHGMPKIQF